MTKIRIISTPPGSAAPEEIRADWVGVEIPVTQDVDQNAPEWNESLNQDGHIVNIDDAIQALRDAGKDAAAQHWERVKAMVGQQLRFGSEHCEIV